jgi:hypothetical protein
MDVELSRPCDKLARGLSIPGSIMDSKMAAVNPKNLYLSTGLRYLRNSKGYNTIQYKKDGNAPKSIQKCTKSKARAYKKVFMDAELSLPSADLFQGRSLPGRITEFKMAAVSRKSLYLSTRLRYP